MTGILKLGFLLILVTSTARAGIMIEPYIGYNSSNFEYQLINAEIDKHQPSGLGYGLRLGYKFLIPWVALDYRATDEKIKNWTADGRAAALTQTQIGAVVGLDLPIGLRVFGGYGFDNKFNANVEDSEDSFKGSYTKLGIGLKPMPFMAINLEYITNKYTKMNLAQTGNTEQDTSILFSKIDMSTVFLSVSLPLNL